MFNDKNNFKYNSSFSRWSRSVNKSPRHIAIQSFITFYYLNIGHTRRTQITLYSHSQCISHHIFMSKSFKSCSKNNKIFYSVFYSYNFWPVLIFFFCIHSPRRFIVHHQNIIFYCVNAQFIVFNAFFFSCHTHIFSDKFMVKIFIL